MTQDEIIELARQAKAIPIHKDFNQLALIGIENIEAFAKLVAEKERDYKEPKPWVGFTQTEIAEFVKVLERGNYLVAINKIEQALKQKNT